MGQVQQTSKRSLFTVLLVGGIIVLSFVSGSLWQRVKQLETSGGVTGGQNSASPLSIDNLKAYAKDLKLNTKDFNKCLDESSKKGTVEEQIKEGAEKGVTGTPGFFLNGHLIAGALPFEIFKDLIDYELATGLDLQVGYPEKIQGYFDQGYIKAEKIEVNTSGHAKGPENAKVVLVEYSDFECPYCVRAYPTVKQILETYPNDVKVVYRQFPLVSLHPNAQKAAEASECAGDQGKFWEYHDKLFEISS